MPQKSNPDLVRNLTPYFPRRGEVLPVIDVTSLQIGAKGDGSTDDTAAIQKALTACSTLGGGVVYLPPYRTYIIGSSGDATNDGIRIYANTVLMGGGWSTILKMGDSTNLDQIIYGQSVSGIHIVDLQIDGDDANQSSTEMYGIRLLDCTYSLIENVYVHNVPASGSAGAGIRIAGTNDYVSFSRIIKARATANELYGVHVYKARNVEISDSYVSANDGSGIRIELTTGGFIVTSNWLIENGHHGIYVTQTTEADGGIITDNHCTRNGQASSNTYSGIRIGGCAGLLVNDNVCVDDAEAATQKYGIEETATSSLNLYVGNLLNGNLSGGISEGGASNKVAHNIGSATHDT